MLGKKNFDESVSSGNLNTIIGKGSSFEGKFYINGSLRIDGKFEGEIKTDEELVVGETGRVKTNIRAKSVVIAGTVIGNIKAENEVTLLATGMVKGDITTPKSIMPSKITKTNIERPNRLVARHLMLML